MLVPSMRWIGLLVPVLAVPWQLEAQVPAAPAPPVSSGSRTPARPGTVAPSAARPAASAAAPAARAQDVPWAGTSDVTGLGTLPTFLQTAAKEKSLDQRPDPTPQQLAALEELQAEVKHFGMVGSAFRDTMGTLLRRDYMRQRRNRDLSFKRQIEHFHQVADRARERKNEGWFDNTERHLDNLYNRLEQRCPAHIERAKALRARRQARALLKTAAKAAIRYFTFGLY